MIRTHKATGWTRQPLGFGRWLITPTDEIRVLRDDGGWSSAKITQTVAAILDREEVEMRR